MTQNPSQPSVPPQTPQAPIQPPPGGPPRDLTLAWLSHVMICGFIIPLVLYLTQKDKDKVVAFHAKQALCWSIVVLGAWVALWIIWAIALAIFWPLAGLVHIVMVVVALGVLAYMIYAIVQTAQGKPFKYFFVADKFCAKEFAAAYPAA